MRDFEFLWAVLLLSVFLLGAALPVCAQPYLPAGHPKYKTAYRVFDALVRAIGDGRTPPRLQLLPRGVGGQLQVAWFQPASHAVVLEERAYDVCVSLGADSLAALAALLGHELAHCYQDHGWVGDFGNGFADLEVGQQLQDVQRSVDKLVELETEADYFGGFCGYMAGYNALGVAPVMLQQIYREYDLDAAMVGYPLLAERQEIARRSAARLADLIPVFEVGYRLLLVRRYEEGARCFDYIARDFPSREVLNNAGAALLLEALERFDPGELRFVYPVELDAQTRLRDGGKDVEYGFAETGEERRRRLLVEARDRFEEARRKDPGYASAWVNLACVADLQGEVDEAMYLAEKGLKLSGEDGTISRAHALLARGIVRARRGPADEAGARQDFVQAQEGSPALAALNLQALESGTLASADNGADRGEKYSLRREQIAGWQVEECEAFVDAPDRIIDLPRSSMAQPTINVYFRKEDTWQGWVVDTGYCTIALLETDRRYSGQSARGIAIGSLFEQVVEVYGPPVYLTAGRQGDWYMYAHTRIAFCIGADRRVQRWILYFVKEP